MKVITGVAVVSLLVGGCGDSQLVPAGGSRSESPSVSHSPSPAAATEDGYPGFHPEHSIADGMVEMPLVFVDGSSATAVAPVDLGIQRMSAALSTYGGLGRVDRSLIFSYDDVAGLRHEGPLETYEGHLGEPVELWEGTPGFWECPHLVFRFDEWDVGVRACEEDLTEHEKEQWARSLQGEVTKEGFLVLSTEAPLVLQPSEHRLGLQMILGAGRSDWIELTPGRCDAAELPDEGDIRTMEDGTRVSFSRIDYGNRDIEYNWFATWCEDGSMLIEVSEAYERFAVAAAEHFRLRDIVLAD